MNNEDAILCLQKAIGLLEREELPRRPARALPRTNHPVSNPQALLESHCRHILKCARRRKAIPGMGELLNPAWYMLVDLFLNHLLGRDICVTSACAASLAPTTTAQRYVRVMEEKGVIERKPHKTDRRRAMLFYTEQGFDMMYRLLMDEIVSYRTISGSGGIDLPEYLVTAASNGGGDARLQK